MEALIGSLIALNIIQFGLLWYRLGRVEGTLREHCKSNGGDNG